jgi:hypothetical protein
MAIYSWVTFSRGWFSISMLVFRTSKIGNGSGLFLELGCSKTIGWESFFHDGICILCFQQVSYVAPLDPYWEHHILSSATKPFPNRWNQKVYSNSKKDAEKVGLATISVEVHTFLHRFGGSPELEPNSAPSAQGIAKSCCALAMSTGGSKFDSNLALFLELQNRYPRFDFQDYL